MRHTSRVEQFDGLTEQFASQLLPLKALQSCVEGLTAQFASQAQDLQSGVDGYGADRIAGNCVE